MTAAQALTHPWLRDLNKQVPLDILIYKLVKLYLRATPFNVQPSRSQFLLLEPNKDGCVSLENFRRALIHNATDAMTESRVPDILNALDPLSYRKMEFEEFCAAVISPRQLEASERWEETACSAFGHFELEGNQTVSVEELAKHQMILLYMIGLEQLMEN